MSPAEPSWTLAAVEQLSLLPKQESSDGDPDAVLVALGYKFEALSAELAALQKEEDTLSSTLQEAEQSNGQELINPSLERIEALLTLLDPIEQAIIAMPAKTVVGLGVKARHAAHVLSNYWTDAPERLDWDARAVRLLIESTCTVAGIGLLPSQQ
jgi:hypothetical protein